MENSIPSSPIAPPPYELPVAKWAMWLAAFLVFVVVMTGKVRYADGDSRYSLLATTALIEHGSLRLDPYNSELDLEKLNNGHNWMIFRSGDSGHFYYDYPVGTQIFSIPFVCVGRMLGMNPIVLEDDVAMQIAITALLCMAIFLLLCRMSSYYLGEWAALLFSMAIFFGSSLISVLGTALWSHGFQTLFTLLVLLELVEHARGKRKQVRGAWLGALLFAAYLCRPTAAAFILPVFGYVAWKSRRSLPWAMGVSAGLFLLFVLWSWLEMHMLLPRYYDPTLWKPGTGFWEHLLPLWFGPARGLWSFTPGLILVFAGWALRKVRFQPLHLLIWVWLLLHTFFLLRSQSPWGGWSFGPRFYTELVPGLALVLLLVAEQLGSLPLRLRNAMAVGFLVLSLGGIYVHSFQGLNNIETQAWNDGPNIDHNWEQRRWDWRHPQFLASAQQRAALQMETALDLQMRQITRNIPEGATILYGPPDPVVRQCFIRWNRANRFGRKQLLCNSVQAVEDGGSKEFWFYSTQLPLVAEIAGVTVDSSNVHWPSLGEFLNANAQYEVFLAGKDDATTSLAEETRSYFRSVGSLLDSVRLRESYLAHLKGGKLIHEAWGPEVLQYSSGGSATVKVKSAGLFAGNFASILVNGQECSPNLRGLNVLVLDENRNIAWITSFDTHANDRERGVMMKGRLR